jgi:tRNA-specific 2-thiouridylase
VAHTLGIPHYILNLERQFDERVVSNFVQEYVAGRTPLPCAHCNADLKFATLLDRARGLDAGLVATGHYARIEQGETGRWLLRRGVDEAKDQSYFLGSLTQAQLAGASFPVGHLTKAEVREVARRWKLAVADKPDSQEICFVPDGDYAAFVANRAPEATRSGAIVDEEGRTLRTHDGVHRFTIGQRRGLGVAAATPLYVLKIEAESGRVIVGPRAALTRAGLAAEAMNWIAIEAPSDWIPAAAQIRHRHRPALGRVRAAAGGGAEFEFDEPEPAVTPGQAVVFYDDDLVIGGGWIARSLP